MIKHLPFGRLTLVALAFISSVLFFQHSHSVQITSSAQNGFQRVEADLQAFDEIVEQMETEFAKLPSNPRDLEWVKRKLKHMVAVDQAMRNYLSTPVQKDYSESEKENFSKEFGSRFVAVDKKNTSDLKKLLKIYPWFVISQFGEEADRNAWLLAQHADQQPEFQKQVLAILASLYKSKETNPQNYAYLFDRVAASFNDPSKQTLQRYGTQGSCVGPGKWEPLPMENPEKIDIRRAEVGLGTMAEYIVKFKEICH